MAWCAMPAERIRRGTRSRTRSTATPSIALFGGTFDPPHNGHLFLAHRAVERCGLERVIFLPARQSPHKVGAPVASDAARLEMLRLATDRLPWAEVSSWEIERPPPSFSWQTAQHFAEVHPGARLCWILGVDQWQALHTWGRPDILADLLHFIVFPRHGIAPAPNPPFRGEFLTDAMEVSATKIRSQLRDGQPVAHLLPPCVMDYLDRHKEIYADAP
jgi:nicotinate-nucleotide adenylyltransferase